MSRLTIALGSVVVCLLFLSAVAADKPSGSDTDHAVLPTARAATPAEHKIKLTLENKTSIDVAEMPPSEWIAYLSDRFHIPIQFDTNALKDAAIDPSTTPVGVQVKDISIRSALDLVLNQRNLTYLIKDEVLLITTQDKANMSLTLSIYDVRDLVSDANHVPDQNVVNQLTTVITTTLAGPTWNSSGGPATIQPFTNNGICVLVISQTKDVHEQIDQLLADLRTFKPQK
jgi:hypothetical protein